MRGSPGREEPIVSSGDLSDMTPHSPLAGARVCVRVHLGSSGAVTGMRAAGRQHRAAAQHPSGRMVLGGKRCWPHALLCKSGWPLAGLCQLSAVGQEHFQIRAQCSLSSR